MSNQDLSPLFQPEVRSTASILHEEPWQGRRGMPSPAVLLLSLVMAIGLGFLYAASFFRITDPAMLAMVVTIGVLLIAGIAITTVTSKEVGRARAIDVLTSVAAAAATLFMARSMGMPVIVAASCTAIVVGFMAVPGQAFDANAAGAGYSGAFVGMMSSDVMVNPYWVMGAAVLAGVLWSLIGPAVWDGVGGRMGAVAYIGAAGVYIAADLMGAVADRPLTAGLDGLAHAAVVPIGCAAALVTWVLIQRMGIPFVLASGLTSLAVCGVLALTLADSAPLAAAWFGGSFVAGGSTGRLPNAGWVGAGGLVFGILTFHFSGPIAGHVGVLGATATIATLAVGAVEWFALAPVVQRRGALVRARLRARLNA